MRDLSSASFSPRRLSRSPRAIRSLEHVHALGFEIDLAEEPDRRLVVDDQNLRHAAPLSLVALVSPTAGSSNANVDPSPSRDSTQILPPIAVTKPRAMKRPSPVPPEPTRVSASAPR